MTEVAAVAKRAVERGQCPACLRLIAIKADGGLRTHLAAVVAGDRPYSDNRCPSAGGRPRPKRPLWR